jgi:hypothetical protein
MSESIDAAKKRLRESFLGQAGIHGVGLSRKEKAIRVYVGPTKAEGRTAVLEQLRKSAEPFRVIVVEEDQPRINPGP